MSTRILGRRFVPVAVLLLWMTTMEVLATTITVTNTNDSGPGSLRQALTIANDGDTITFAVIGAIGLTVGGLPVTKDLTISGPGSNQLSIDGNQALLVFGIFPGKIATISGLSIRNGQLGIWNYYGTLTISNCIVSGNSYGGLYNDSATSTVSNCVISDNSGTGIYSHYGTLTVSDCDVSGNGAGIDNDHGTASVSNCVISGNSYGLYNDASHLSASDNLTDPNDYTLSVSNCVISGNSQFGIGNNGILGPPPAVEQGNHRRDAAKIYDYPVGIAPVTVENSIIRDNSGPGVDNNSGTVTIVNSMLTGNHNPAGQDSGYGGGIYTHGGKLPGYVTVSNSTISGNSAFYSGGGIAASNVTIVNSTISGNSAGDSGGGIASYHAVIANSTISGNSASSGGGISIGYQGSTLEISDTILNAGASGENIFNNGGTVMSHGYNISSDNGGGYLTGPGDQINTDPLLGPLQDNGGPTLTHMPLRGSPAIDAGDPNFTPPPFYDQRGQPFVRVFHGRVDIGSVETQPRRSRPTPAPRPTPH